MICIVTKKKDSIKKQVLEKCNFWFVKKFFLILLKPVGHIPLHPTSLRSPSSRDLYPNICQEFWYCLIRRRILLEASNGFGSSILELPHIAHSMAMTTAFLLSMQTSSAKLPHFSHFFSPMQRISFLLKRVLLARFWISVLCMFYDLTLSASYSTYTLGIDLSVKPFRTFNL